MIRKSLLLFAFLLVYTHQGPTLNIFPQTLVLTFDHALQANQVGDPQQKGDEHGGRYYHIITPLKNKDLVMYRYDLTGYAYGMSQPLDITWVGYNYVHGNSPVQTQAVNRNKDLYKISHMSQYYKSDGRLVLIFGPIDRYHTGFSLFYQGHYRNQNNGGNFNGYQMKVTCSKAPLA